MTIVSEVFSFHFQSTSCISRNEPAQKVTLLFAPNNECPKQYHGTEYTQYNAHSTISTTDKIDHLKQFTSTNNLFQVGFSPVRSSVAGEIRTSKSGRILRLYSSSVRPSDGKNARKIGATMNGRRTQISEEKAQRRTFDAEMRRNDARGKKERRRRDRPSRLRHIIPTGLYTAGS